MKLFTKTFDNIPAEDVAREVELQTRASKIGLSPNILHTDHANFITMEYVDAMCLADMYGDSIDDVPDDIQNQILDILWVLYNTCHIEYVDITPYNFIENDGVVLIIDFGHARDATDTMDPFLEKLFDTWKLEWNPEFK